ncbi:MAG: hypothetical protein AAGJ46_15725 [Planctomycetota bacterium]
MTKRTLLSIAIALKIANAAQAGLVQYEFAGHVVRGSDPRFFPPSSAASSPIGPGAPVTGRLSYDPNVTIETTGSRYTDYRQTTPAELVIQIGGVDFATHGDFLATVINELLDAWLNPGQRDYGISFVDGEDPFNPLATGRLPATGNTILINGIPVSGIIGLGFDDRTLLPRSASTDLPARMDVARLGPPHAGIYYLLGDPLGRQKSVRLSIRINTIRQVPEPHTAAAVVALGAISLLGAGRPR